MVQLGVEAESFESRNDNFFDVGDSFNRIFVTNITFGSPYSDFFLILGIFSSDHLASKK